MSPLAIVLAAIGVSDIIASLSGSATSSRRAWIAWGTALLIAILGGVSIGYELGAVLSLMGATGVWSGLWLGARLIGQPSPSRAAVALLCFGIPSLVFVTTTSLWPQPLPESVLAKWFETFPFHMGSRSLSQFLLFGAVGLVEIATANGIVRLVLTLAGSLPFSSSPLVLAGRFIGPLERLLILGFASAGEPTAAALVASAKTILRFPELSGHAPTTAARPEGDERTDASQAEPTVTDFTEYVLLGSLCSWFVALVPIIFLVSTS